MKYVTDTDTPKITSIKYPKTPKVPKKHKNLRAKTKATIKEKQFTDQGNRSRENQDFFTPNHISQEMFDSIEQYLRPKPYINEVLDPAAGSGSLIKPYLKESIQQKYNINITAYEIQSEYVKKLLLLPIKVQHSSYLESTTIKKYDIIVQNPPFVLGNSHPLYKDFVLKALEDLKPTGAMVTISPANMLINTTWPLIRQHVVRLRQMSAKTMNIQIDTAITIFLKEKQKDKIDVHQKDSTFDTTPLYSIGRDITNIPLINDITDRNRTIISDRFPGMSDIDIYLSIFDISTGSNGIGLVESFKAVDTVSIQRKAPRVYIGETKVKKRGFKTVYVIPRWSELSEQVKSGYHKIAKDIEVVMKTGLITGRSDDYWPEFFGKLPKIKKSKTTPGESQ